MRQRKLQAMVVRDRGVLTESMTHAVEYFGDRVDRHLAWCVEQGHISADKAREILGVSVETMREVTREWIAAGWMSKNEDAL